MFKRGDLVQVFYPNRHPGRFHRWNGIRHGDIGVVLEEMWGYKFQVYFSFHTENTVKVMIGYHLLKTGESK
jgi:hypothetical protein